MNITSANIVSNLISLSWLTGPIFDKELRVSSRRRRYYFLRSGFCLLLGVFILSMWYSTIGIRSSNAVLYQVSRFSQVSRTVVISFVWFQFIAAQLIAIILLSSSISDEIRSGTLSVLLTTPINSFQIVTGKLLSRLLQVILLLAISLPILAIIRVFGGIPWDYIVSSICITITAAVFAGASSLLLSTTYYYAYNVILVIIVGYALFFGALPGFFAWLAGTGIFNQQATHSVIALINPFWAMAAVTQRVSTPSLSIFSWPLHCLIMLAATVIILTIPVRAVRKAALTEAFAKKAKPRSKKTAKNQSGIHSTDSYPPTGPMKRITGAPVIWKEMYKGFLGTGKTDRTITVLLVALFCLTAVLFLFSAFNRNRNIIIFPYYLMSGIYLIVMIRLAIATAGSIAGEKEARTLPILLVTPLEDKEIIHGKIIAALWRNVPLLILYLFLLCIFYYGMNNLQLIQILMSLPVTVGGLVCSVLYVIGSGTYFGVRFKTATAAIAATLGSYLALRFLFCGMFNPFRFILYTSIMRSRMSMIAMSLVISIVPTLALGVLGIFLERRAIRRLRRNIF